MLILFLAFLDWVASLLDTIVLGWICKTILDDEKSFCFMLFEFSFPRQHHLKTRELKSNRDIILVFILIAR